MNHLKVLITGAVGGLGSELALQLAQRGASLLLIDLDSSGLDALSDRICAKNLEEPGVCPLDLANSGPAEFEAIVEILEAQFGGLDVFIHCAAVFPGLQPIDQILNEKWQECMQVNVNAAWQATRSFLPLLKAGEKGRIILIHDNEQISGSAYWGAYGVSKAALNSFGKILEQELHGTTVKVMNHFPGPMRTGLRAKAYLAEDPGSVPCPSSAAAIIIDKLESSFPD